MKKYLFCRASFLSTYRRNYISGLPPLRRVFYMPMLKSSANVEAGAYRKPIINTAQSFPTAPGFPASSVMKQELIYHLFQVQVLCGQL